MQQLQKKAKLLRFAFGGHEGRDSTMGDAIPIWADGTFKPVRVWLSHGKTELLFGGGYYQKARFNSEFREPPIQGWTDRMGNDDL